MCSVHFFHEQGEVGGISWTVICFQESSGADDGDEEGDDEDDGDEEADEGEADEGDSSGQ